MREALHSILFAERFERRLDVLIAAVVAVGTFVMYATGGFSVDGGVVFLPSDATLVGAVAAAGIGYRRGSLIGAWVTVFGAYIGFFAEWAFLGLSSHTFAGKLAFLFDPVSLGLSALAAVVIGTISFAVGYLAVRGVNTISEGRTGS
ncbi:hypothetical protein [Halorubrum laminariae]|uniref:DUF5518 domain-containing protein n=1 Tax=Halorubrum laminariae TaxID=1433523 RepID=A0ABD6C4A1_9EURY|nr:hypothetical protein [Halorubrum laminariae]